MIKRFNRLITRWLSNPWQETGRHLVTVERSYSLNNRYTQDGVIVFKKHKYTGKERAFLHTANSVKEVDAVFARHSYESEKHAMEHNLRHMHR